MRAKSPQTLCDPMVCSPPGSSFHGVLQARILESVAMFSSRESSWPGDQTHISSISCTGRWILYHLCHLGSPIFLVYLILLCLILLCVFLEIRSHIFLCSPKKDRREKRNREKKRRKREGKKRKKSMFHGLILQKSKCNHTN